MSLREVYGEVILKKGSVLYHTSDAPFYLNDQKPFLFLTFHPADWDLGKYRYVTRFILQKDVSLFFMVGGIRGLRIQPLLDTLIGEPSNNLHKQYLPKQICYGRYLLKDGFDGWFSTIEGKTTVEVGLLNLFDTYSYEPSIQVTEDSRIRYPIATQVRPAIFHINERYRDDLTNYMRLASSASPLSYTFQIILTNAIIRYHNHPFKSILWNCTI